MHLNILSSFVALSLATTALADRLIVSQYCYFSCSYPAIFITSAGTYDVNAAGGCRGATSVPGMTDLCIDWPAARGHFKFSHQSNKRCLKETSSEWYDCGIASCYTVVFDEVPCSWRVAGDEAEEGAEPLALPSVSAT